MTYKTITDLKLGDIVYTYDQYNGSNKEPEKHVVDKITTKLITVTRIYSDINKGIQTKFRKDTLHDNGDYGHTELIIDLNEFNDRKKKSTLVNKILDFARGNEYKKLSLEQLKKACEFLNIETE